MEKVDFTIKALGSLIEIIPSEIKDNSIYEIRLKNIKSLDGKKVLDSETVIFYTKASPAYTTLMSVRSLIGDCDLTDDVLLYHIREASKYVDYVVKNKNVKYQMVDAETVDFQKDMLVKYKAAHECALRFYIDKVSESEGLKGTLGDVTFDTNEKQLDISKMLKALKEEANAWDLALQGHTHIRAGIKTGVKSSTVDSYNNSSDAVISPEYSRRNYI